MSSSLQGYSIFGYGDMILDRYRLDPYVQALKSAIKPGDVVLDIGTGTGFFDLAHGKCTRSSLMMQF
jgi:ubiquinone/menaquinone biosynthesis C-methylase UbiE